jgi:hypothetical protein
MYASALTQAKRRFGHVADVVRHLKELGFVNASSNVGILTNSATHELNCAEVLEITTSSQEHSARLRLF